MSELALENYEPKIVGNSEKGKPHTKKRLQGKTEKRKEKKKKKKSNLKQSWLLVLCETRSKHAKGLKQN